MIQQEIKEMRAMQQKKFDNFFDAIDASLEKSSPSRVNLIYPHLFFSYQTNSAVHGMNAIDYLNECIDEVLKECDQGDYSRAYFLWLNKAGGDAAITILQNKLDRYKKNIEKCKKISFDELDSCSMKCTIKKVNT
jgi:hypothetical protein